MGFRTFTAADVSTLDTWLRQAILPSEQNPHHLLELALDWCREHRLEPPTPQRLERLIRSALHRHESVVFDTIAQQLPPRTRAHCDSWLAPGEGECLAEETEDDPAIGATVFSQLKTTVGKHLCNFPGEIYATPSEVVSVAGYWYRVTLEVLLRFFVRQHVDPFLAAHWWLFFAMRHCPRKSLRASGCGAVQKVHNLHGRFGAGKSLINR